MKENTYYQQFKKYYLAIDCVIFGFNGAELEIILIKRNFEPGLGEWALPGVFLEPEESMEDASQRALESFTGMKNVFMEQFHCFSDPKRDPGARIITTGFFALISINKSDKARAKKHNAYWVKLSELPKLMFDHKQIVEKATEALKSKTSNQPVGFELLPKKFTLPQLQSLYEAIYNVEFDKRNFRKKINQMGLIEKLDEKDMTTSKRGAFLYKFNKKKYNEKVKKGFVFEI